jgi:methionyl-tRNA formyltransferase
VVCQPDRPRGRGLAVEAPEVKALALERGLPILQPEKFRDPALLDALRALSPDLIVVAAYGRILPRTILDLPAKGCINVHGSILPRHRGAAPIAHAIMAGDAETGVSIMEMTEEMDAGDVLLVRPTPIAPDDTTGTLGERLAALGAAAIGAAIDGLHAGALHPQPQPREGVTFAPKIEREQARLDWTRPAVELERVVRAMLPAPAAFTTIDGRLLKVHRAALAPAAPGSPGSVVAAGTAGIDVATGDGALRLVEVQLEGKKRMAAGPFVAGHPLPPGTRLG